MPEPLPQDIFEQSEAIAQADGPDAAARFLAPYRKEACEALETTPSQLGTLLQISSQQVYYLCLAGAPDKAVGIAEWFLHTLHHLEAAMSSVDFVQLKRALRETFSRFFMRYARALRDLDRIEDMRLSVRTALDLTQALPFAIVSMAHLYLPLHSRVTLENEPAKDWLLKRYAECLAALDFSGLHDTPFRQALDEYQYGLRDEDKRVAACEALEQLTITYPDDVSVATLKNLLKTL